MMISEMIKELQQTLESSGDMILLDTEEYEVSGITVDTVSAGQREFWGVPKTDPDFKYAQIRSNS